MQHIILVCFGILVQIGANAHYKDCKPANLYCPFEQIHSGDHTCNGTVFDNTLNGEGNNDSVAKVAQSAVLDTYGVDGNGNIKKLDDKKYYDNNGNSVNRLYAIDSEDLPKDIDLDGAIGTGDYIELGIKTFYSQSKDEKGQSFTIGNKEDAKRVFLFASEHSYNEFGLLFLGGNVDFALLVTTFDSSLMEIIFNIGEAYNERPHLGITIEAFFRNYPRDDPDFPSGFKRNGAVDSKNPGDRYILEAWRNGGLKNVQGYIYHPSSQQMIQYDDKSFTRFPISIFRNKEKTTASNHN